MADILGNTSTTVTIPVGGSVSSDIEFKFLSADSDWFRIDLPAGTYRFDMLGLSTLDGSLINPFLTLRDAAGNAITSDDNGGFLFNSRIEFTTSGGSYYLDARGVLSLGTYTLRVTPLNVDHAPTAVKDTGNAVEDGSPVLIDVLANDTDPDSGDTKTLLSVENAGATGTASVSGSQVSYDPGSHFQNLNLGQTTTDTFTYTMKDGAGVTSTATVTITITGTNDVPVAVADAAAGGENQTLTIDVLANDTDVDDGHSFTLQSVQAPSGQGMASITNNKLVFDPGHDFDYLKQGQTAVVVLDYVMNDEHGAKSSSTLTVTITGTNDAPTVVHNVLTPALAACDTDAVIGADDLLSSDPDSSILTYTIDASHAGIVLIDGEIAGSGATFTQADIDAGHVSLLAGPVSPTSPVSTPNGPISGAGLSFFDSFHFTVSDGDGGATPGTFTANYVAFDTVQTSAQYGGYWGGNGNDYQLGTGGADNMSGGNGCDLMIGGAGNDQMSGGEGNNRLFGKEGNDNLSGGSGNDLLDGGAGDDQIHANGGSNWLFGGAGNDNMSAGDGNDRMWGGDGRDSINANGGNNRIDAGADNDTVTAGNGDDTIILGTGDDVVYANGGLNKFQLGGIAAALTDGNDQYTGGSGADKYALYLNDRAGAAAGWGNDTVNGFRLAEGDQLVAFNSKTGFWDDAGDLGGLIDSGFVSGNRSADGGDLKLTFGIGAEKSTITLKWFFWDNASFLTSSEKATGFGQAVGKGDLIDILQKAVQDGGSVGVSGSDFVPKGHSYISHDFMMA
jgi:VCBS repeat-containing protein